MCFNWAEQPPAVTHLDPSKSSNPAIAPTPAAGGAGSPSSNLPAASPVPEHAPVPIERRRPGRPRRPAGAPPTRRPKQSDRSAWSAPQGQPESGVSKPLIVDAPAPYLPSGSVRRLGERPAKSPLTAALPCLATAASTPTGILPMPAARATGVRKPRSRALESLDLTPMMDVRHLLRPAERDMIEALATHGLSLPAIARLTGRDARRLRCALRSIQARITAPLFRFVMQTRCGSASPHPTVRLGPGLSAIAEAIVFRGLSQRQAAAERRLTLHQVRRARDLLIRLFVAHLDDTFAQRPLAASLAPPQAITPEASAHRPQHPADLTPGAIDLSPQCSSLASNPTNPGGGL